MICCNCNLQIGQGGSLRSAFKVQIFVQILLRYEIGLIAYESTVFIIFHWTRSILIGADIKAPRKS